MPLYEYKCRGCGDSFEKLIWKSDTPDSEIKCPSCGEFKSTRKLSRFSFGSRNNRGEFKRAPSSGGCSTCTSGNCATCG